MCGLDVHCAGPGTMSQKLGYILGTMFCALTTYFAWRVEFEKWWLECENWSGKVGSLNTSLRQKLQRTAEEERREIVTERRGSLALVKRELNSGTAGQCVKTWASASSLNSGLCTFAPLHRQRLCSMKTVTLCSILSAEADGLGVSTALCSVMHHSVSPLLLFCGSPVLFWGGLCSGRK